MVRDAGNKTMAERVQSRLASPWTASFFANSPPWHGRSRGKKDEEAKRGEEGERRELRALRSGREYTKRETGYPNLEPERARSSPRSPECLLFSKDGKRRETWRRIMNGMN